MTATVRDNAPRAAVTRGCLVAGLAVCSAPERGIRRAREDGGSPVTVGCGRPGRCGQPEAVPGGQAGRVGHCLSGAWRLVADLLRPLRDLGKIAGLDQFMRLEPAESARSGDRQAQGGRGLGVRQLEDDQTVVLPEDSVVGLHAAAGRLPSPRITAAPVRGPGDKPLDQAGLRPDGSTKVAGGRSPATSRRDALRLPGNGARVHTWSKVPRPEALRP